MKLVSQLFGDRSIIAFDLETRTQLWSVEVGPEPEGELDCRARIDADARRVDRRGRGREGAAERGPRHVARAGQQPGLPGGQGQRRAGRAEHEAAHHVRQRAPDARVVAGQPPIGIGIGCVGFGVVPGKDPVPNAAELRK